LKKKDHYDGLDEGQNQWKVAGKMSFIRAMKDKIRGKMP
jgi:hypothetical protein